MLLVKDKFPFYFVASILIADVIEAHWCGIIAPGPLRPVVPHLFVGRVLKAQFLELFSVIKGIAAHPEPATTHLHIQANENEFFNNFGECNELFLNLRTVLFEIRPLADLMILIIQ